VIEVIQIPVLQDNFIYLLREPGGLVACVDPAVAGPLRHELAKRDWKLDFIFNTHHHRDHVGANLELKAAYGCKIYGAAKDAARIPGMDIPLKNGDEFLFGAEKIKVIGCDGHTMGHIAYWLPESFALFSGDTIFSLGCGKLFEGTPELMWDSLSRLRDLPPETLIYGAHEYTLENAQFALRVEPGNVDLLARIFEVKSLLSAGKNTVPTTIAQEKATNPFLRPESFEIQNKLGVQGKELWQIFGATRARKDQFDSSGEF
jgi:hydroxyacylglutathione hydrolase